MADFQQQVNGQPSEGQAGQLVDGVFTPALGYLSDGTLEAGQFAFTDTKTNDEAPFASKKVAANGRLLGVVMRTQTGMLESPFIAASNTYHKGAPLAIAARGRIYFKVPNGTPTVGQHVCVDPTSGAVSFAEKGGANDTGWEVARLASGKTTAAENDLIIIENLGG